MFTHFFKNLFFFYKMTLFPILGRAGRTGPGICYRMYSEEDLKHFESFTPAEIHLVPLDSLILQMASLGLSDISNFPFLEQPSMKSLTDSIEKLRFVEAIELNDEGLVLTQLGDALSQLPVDIHIGKYLKNVLSLKLWCLHRPYGVYFYDETANYVAHVGWAGSQSFQNNPLLPASTRER